MQIDNLQMQMRFDECKCSDIDLATLKDTHEDPNDTKNEFLEKT